MNHENIYGPMPHKMTTHETYYDILFDRTLAQSAQGRKITDPNLTKPHIGTMPNDQIVSIKYNFNSHGYRSTEFSSPADVLILGCSNTFGMGLPEEFTWSNIFAKSVRVSHHKIATAGDSTAAQVYKAFKYFREIGNPKTVIAVLPARRLELPLIYGKFEKQQAMPKFKGATKPKKITKGEDSHRIQQISLENESFIEFAKAPFNPEAVIPSEIGLFYTFAFIQMLEQYCEANNIRLMWNLWDDNPLLYYIKENLPHILKNYIELDIPNYNTNAKTGIMTAWNDNNNSFEELGCHPRHKDHPLYHHGADFIKGSDPGHWGIHLHRHLAEKIINYYNEGKNDK